MGSKERIHRLKEQTKVNILDAAYDIVKDEGWQALSMRKIADRIEYTAPIIYEYYANKEAILHELTRKGFVMLAERMKEARDKHQDLAAQIEALWLAYWNFAFQEKEYYQLMFGVEVNCCMMDEILPTGTTPYDIAARPIADMMGIGDPEDDRVCTKYYTYWSIIHGLISINIVRKGTSDEINRQILKDAITGITRSLTRQQ
ncbi:MAG TPA: TetR/AcrR family transcriptional regulator [Puia sp.]|nr:TetR/AcrR family transcriptional regulator [Puia sp.]